jgi:SAM-dependent methyltransferase
MTLVNLSRLAFGFGPAQVVHAAVELGVPEALAAAPGGATLASLADRLGCDPDSLARLLRALVVLGVAEDRAPGRYALTDLGRPLCPDDPQSIRRSVLLFGDQPAWMAWGALAAAVRTGEAAFDLVHGRPLFAYLAEHSGSSETFNNAMHEGTRRMGPQVPALVDLSQARMIVDVGGGSGALLAAVLAGTPESVHGVLFDTPRGTAGAQTAFADAGVADGRWSIEHGDFFRDALPGGDVLMLKGILHDWNDERCAALLSACRSALAPAGRLLVLEPVLPDRPAADAAHETAAAVMSDMAMLVYTGGRERSAAGYRGLLRQAGLELTWVTQPLPGTAVRILVAERT